MHRHARRARGRRPHHRGSRRLRHLLVLVRPGRGCVDPRRSRSALRGVAHVGWWRLRGRARPRGRGDPRRHGHGVRHADDAAATAQAARRFGDRRRARLRDHVGGREHLRRWRRAPERGVRRQRGAAVTGPQLLGARPAAHAPLRHEAGALRRGRDLGAGERDPAPGHRAPDPAAHARRVLRGADDLGPAVSLRLHPGDRRRGCGHHRRPRTGRRISGSRPSTSWRRRTVGRVVGGRRSSGTSRHPTRSSRRRVTARWRSGSTRWPA